MSAAAKLLYKEWRLVVGKPLLILFLLIPMMLVVPNYPYAVVMGYAILAVFTLFNIAEANRDVDFTATLPVRRADIVLSKAIAVWTVEGGMLLTAVPFAVISNLVLGANRVGLDANLAFFGFTLAEYAVFNAIFLPVYFLNGHKTGWGALLGLIGYAAVVLAVELTVHFVPALGVLDSRDVSDFGYQAIVLAAGPAVFAAAALFTVRAAVKCFAKVNL